MDKKEAKNTCYKIKNIFCHIVFTRLDSVGFSRHFSNIKIYSNSKKLLISMLDDLFGRDI
mgnify:FL=1